jgi:hypothetical protein
VGTDVCVVLHGNSHLVHSAKWVDVATLAAPPHIDHGDRKSGVRWITGRCFPVHFEDPEERRGMSQGIPSFIGNDQRDETTLWQS